jgi:hypothetical protein
MPLTDQPAGHDQAVAGQLPGKTILTPEPRRRIPPA